MADTKISALTAYSSGDPNDLLDVVDVSDTTMAATGTNKKATIAQALAAGLGPRVVYIQTATVTLTAAATGSLINTTGAVGSVSLNAGFLDSLGRSLRVRAHSLLTTPASGEGNGTYAILLGGNVIATTAATPLAASNASPGRGLVCETLSTVVGTGASGSIDTVGMAVGHNSWTGSAATGIYNGTAAGTTAAGTPVTIDLTAALTLDVQWTFSAAVNSLSLINLTVEVLG